MTLPELLQYFTTSDTIGENKDVVEMLRFYSCEAQKITMKINTAYHEPEEIVSHSPKIPAIQPLVGIKVI